MNAAKLNFFLFALVYNDPIHICEKLSSEFPEVVEYVLLFVSF